MEKHLFKQVKMLMLLTFMAISIETYCQPVIADGSNVPTPGFTAPAAMATATLGVGNGGANQTWDFSALNFTSISNVSVITPSSAPIGSSFPTANFAYTLAGT